MSASEAKTALDNFFTNTEAKVLFLKGKWGSGKSYFVRDYLKHNSQAPEYQFFVSLFGLTSLKEVRESINANLSIRSRNAEGVKNAINKISKLADKTKEITEAFGAKAVGTVAAWVASAGDSLFWQYAHSKECVIVFDDLERTKLPIEDILGLASSLSENTKAKIIIIFNEDELDDSDKATLTKYREKVADNEVLFNPSLEEMVANHLRHKALREVVQQIFGRLQITNIRLLRKIDINIETFAALIKPHKITPSVEENLRMAKLVCVKYLSPKPIPVLLVSSGFFGLSLNKQKTEEDTKLHELVRQLDMFPAYPLDELMFECIENGYCSEESIQKQIAAHQTNKQRDEFNAAQMAAYATYGANFSGTTKDAINEMKVFLDKYAGTIATEALVRHLSFLTELGYKGSAEEWKKANLTLISGAPSLTDQEAAAKMLLPSPVVKRFLNNLSKSIHVTGDPLSIMRRINKSSGWTVEDTATRRSSFSNQCFFLPIWAMTAVTTKRGNLKCGNEIFRGRSKVTMGFD